jgi:hypothetical protein
MLIFFVSTPLHPAGEGWKNFIKEMQISIFYNMIIILAFALPSLRISPPFLIRIATIALLYAAALSFKVVYIQSIGSGIGIFSGLFQGFLAEQGIETFFYLVNALNFTLIGPLLSSLLPVRPSHRLTKEEKSQLCLSDELKQILVGLLLGFDFLFKRK